MTPDQVAASYDQIADRWLDVSTYGFAQVERAVAFVENKGVALDVGCGTGRLIALLGKHGFRTDGLDVSPAMIALARQRHPEARLFHDDISRWQLPRSYDLIVAWDSVWHVPLGQQEAVLTKLCRGLQAGGVLVFTTGGTDAPGEKQDSCMGPPMYHATLGVPKTLQVLAEAGCVCRHLEYDQHPELHVYIIAQKAKGDGPTTSDLIRLRNVGRGDLPRMYEMQLDPESNRLAATIPRTAEAFEAHWATVLRDPSLTAKAILLGDEMVGNVSCFWCDNLANVGYWISREHWGKGIASRALELLLLEVPTRPLYAHVATGNGASLRVLQKCGFVVEQVRLSPASDRYLPPQARFSKLLDLPEGENIGKAINEAMKAVEAENEELKGVLPKTYNKIENSTLVSLLKTFSQIAMDAEGDTFGRIYEYFLGNFARAEGQKGGEFFTPTSLVKLIVEIIEPYHGRIFYPASGSGGMFVQSADFIKAHKNNPSVEISVYGQERVDETRHLCLMNLAVHALSGDIRQGNSYYEDLHGSVGKFDFVMANPPFNVDKVDKEKIKDDPRFPLGMPRADNANYLWIQLFYSSLGAKGRAGFVMANSAADARQSEMEIRKKLLQAHAVDVMIAIGPNFFYTVTLPCTLWFFDKGKAKTERKDKVLFIDARHIFRQMDRAHRKFSPKQVEFIANIARLYRGEKPEFEAGDDDEYPGPDPELKETFPKLKYADVAGLCKVATLKEIEAQGWSLNPGRYVGVAEKGADEFVFAEKLEELNEELEVLNSEARELEDRIAANVAKLLEASS